MVDETDVNKVQFLVQSQGIVTKEGAYIAIDCDAEDESYKWDSEKTKPTQIYLYVEIEIQLWIRCHFQVLFVFQLHTNIINFNVILVRIHGLLNDMPLIRFLE